MATVPRGCTILGFFAPGETIKAVFRSLRHPVAKYCLKRAENEQMLRSIDLKLSMKNFRFGVVLISPEDIDEEDALMNNKQPDSFTKFISGLGDKIELQNWPHYSGGLDTTSNLTGSKSLYYRTLTNNQVMFQIASWIPCRTIVDRKRLIGNNVLNILFLEKDDCEFKLNSFVSKQTHCLVLICQEDDNYVCTAFRRHDGKYEKHTGPITFHFEDRGTKANFINFRTPLDVHFFIIEV